MSETFLLGGELEVRRIGFGTLHLTGPLSWGEPADPERSKAVLRRAVELGVNLIDTADSYGPDVAERLIAEALHPYPEGLVIATKGGKVRSGPSREIWPADGRPEHLRGACEGSLRRLRLDCIDLYQLHMVDPEVPVEESVGALADLQREGKIRHIGVSNVTAAELARVRRVADVVSVQNSYNLDDRESDDVLEACERDGLAFLAWQPLAFGDLASGERAVDAIARTHDATPAQVALAWLLERSPALVAIPGTSSIDHLDENVAAERLRLTGAERRALTER